MARRLLLGGLLGLAVACHAKSYSPTNVEAGGSGGGDDAGSDCSCVLDNGAGVLVLACGGGTGCADGVTYTCTDLGTALPGLPCGPADAASESGGGCVTTCTGKTCNVPDSCGGLCKCAAGVTCNADGTCGNGCDLAVGDVCSQDAGTATMCCSSGYACFEHDSGVGTCCAVFGAGHCTQDVDCCDYPVAHCSTTTGTCG